MKIKLQVASCRFRFPDFGILGLVEGGMGFFWWGSDFDVQGKVYFIFDFLIF